MISPEAQDIVECGADDGIQKKKKQKKAALFFPRVPVKTSDACRPR